MLRFIDFYNICCKYNADNNSYFNDGEIAQDSYDNFVEYQESVKLGHANHSLIAMCENLTGDFYINLSIEQAESILSKYLED